MSKKEIEKKHGPILSWDMKKFYTYKEFKEMPDDIQVEYVNYLVKTYHVGLTTISTRLFDIAEPSLGRYLNGKNLSKKLYKLPKGYRANRQTIKEFEQAVNAARSDDVSLIEVEHYEDAQQTAYSPNSSMKQVMLSYISDGIDYVQLRDIEKLFDGERISVTIQISVFTI